jgi:hypothetical protein
MAWYIARVVATNKIKSVTDDNGLDEIYRLIDAGWTVYRIEPAVTPGQFTLIPQALTGVTTTPVTTGGTLVDA